MSVDAKMLPGTTVRGESKGESRLLGAETSHRQKKDHIKNNITQKIVNLAPQN